MKTLVFCALILSGCISSTDEGPSYDAGTGRTRCQDDPCARWCFVLDDAGAARHPGCDAGVDTTENVK